MTTVQNDFSGGMNQFLDASSIAQNEYALGFNLRNRDMGLTPIRIPVEDTTLPIGKKQGVYAFDVFILAFVSGFGYYKNVRTDTVWTRIDGMFLDANADYIYTALVPASTNDFKRKLITDNQVLGSPQSIPLQFELSNGSGSLRGLVVQDGTNQPYFIAPDGTARLLNKYSEWTQSDREYVPIMKQMIYVDGILFGMASDGVTLLRSVSGRPLDFVVNVTSTGDKGGDATTTSYSIGFNTVNCIGVNSDGNLLLGGDKLITILELNFDKTIFAEPTFSVIKEYSIGVINQFSFVKYIPNFHFTIDKDGMRTFTSDQITDTNENRNSRFTAYISKALSVKQTVGACVIFDDYLMASVSTKFAANNYVVVYDNITQQWVSIDTQNETIKMFAIADQSENPTLYAISDSKIYKLLSGTQALAEVDTKAFNSGTGSGNQKLKDVFAVFAKGSIASTATVIEFEDGVINKSVEESLVGDPLETRRFNFLNRANQCWMSQLHITWQNDAALRVVEHQSQDIAAMTSLQQQSAAYAR